MTKKCLSLIAFLLAVISPIQGQEPSLVAEKGRVVKGDVTEEAQDRPEADPSDVDSPSAIVEALVESVSSEADERPEWDRYRSLFLPVARLISTGRDSAGDPVHDVLTVREVLESADTERGTEDYLVERLLYTEIDRFGDIAHVLYTYELLESPHHSEPRARGVASLQLWYDGDRWWIVTLTWHGERDGAPIPERYLGGS